MRRFLIYILVLFFLTFGIAYTIEYAADMGLRKFKKGILNEWVAIHEGSVNADILIVGSSRAYTGYNPTIISGMLNKKAYNLSVNGGGYNIQKMKFDLYSNANKAPQFVVQNIDLSHFMASEKIFEEYQYLSYYSKDIIKKTFIEIDDKYAFYNTIPLIKYNTNKEYLKRSLRTLILGKVYNEPELIDGFCPKNKKFRLDSLNLQRFERLDTSYQGHKKFELGYEHTVNFASQLSDSSIKTIFVWAPEYEKRLKADKTLRTYFSKKIDSIASLDPNIYFLDLSDTSISYDQENYYDSFHLTSKGADAFSSLLSTEIKKIVVNQ
ncbi:hypothetical protein ACFO3O_20470 [Dokdonia ponticola]|uniref:SGNH/GDSL hydrolase family protein n=1 Tax=Dokdonia ponticola TaxID=2041041 RepID=A0ABV9I272_9FLAO